LARIARELDLDVSSIVFVDDNPAERDRVRSALPWAMVPELGADSAEFGRALLASGYFEHMVLTAEDTNRAQAYQARAEATAVRETVADYAEYLRSLKMELAITPFDAIGRARVAQLAQKSNQFNLTTIRYSESEIEAIERDAKRLAWQIRLRDRFADHGMICVVIVDKAGTKWRIDSWIMSCRVLERGVEQAVMAELAARARREGASTLIGEYRPTARNALVRDFYPKLGFAATQSTEANAMVYELDLAKATFTPTMISVTTTEKEEAAL
jgi:FkbH-like protein